jgi:hypothetical protein
MVAPMNQAIHTVDLLLWIFDLSPGYAQASTCLHSIEVEDTAVAVLGARVARPAARSDDLQAPRLPEARRADRHRKHDRHRARSDHPIRHAVGRAGSGVGRRVTANASASSPTVSTLGASAHHPRFRQGHRTGGTPICDGCEGRRVALVEAIYKSAKTRQPVDL